MAEIIDFNEVEAFASQQGIAAVLAEHPEVKLLFESRARLDGPVQIHGVNPIIHVLIEAAVESQIQQENPPAAKAAFTRLQELGLSIHAARGVMARVFLPHMFTVIKENSRFDEEVYTRQLNFLGSDLGKIGRNESCPCGSGRKYKKCCLPDADNLTISADAGKLILGANFYCSLEYLQTLPSDSTQIQLENRAHIAEYLEEHGVFEGALACLQENVALADRDYPDLVVNALQDLQLLCCNHSELSNEGLEVNERLISLVSDDEKGTYRCDKADLLAVANGLEAAENEYLATFADIPDYHFARYRYALLLNDHDRSNEAEGVLRALLERVDEIDDETYEEAETLLQKINKGK